MVHITDDCAAKKQDWERAGIVLPPSGCSDWSENSWKSPYWLHFGAGNLFRAVHAPIAQTLLDKGLVRSGIFVAETFDPEIIEKIYEPYNNRCLQVVLKADGSTNLRLITSVAGAFKAQQTRDDWEKLEKIFVSPSLQLVTVTITEKGYALRDGYNNLLPSIDHEISAGPDQVTSAIGIITALLLARFKASAAPLALISTDNFSKNGDKFRSAVLDFAYLWETKSFVSREFVDWVSDTSYVSFPLTMIDRITPNPAPDVAALLQKNGFADTEIVHTQKGTNIAAFANTEETWYLVVEDDFPNGRPDLSQAGVYVTDRETVNLADEMKVTTCLNPLHTALAVFGMLFSIPRISQAVADPDLHCLINTLGVNEDLPVADNPQIFSPQEFLHQVIDKRLPNPYIPDTPRRISTDTSQKIPVRYGVTLKKYARSPDLDLDSLRAIPLIVAAWLRLLIGSDGHGTDDGGNDIILSPDPRLADLQRILLPLSRADAAHADITRAEVEPIISPILADTSIFGLDLTKTSLSGRIADYLARMIQGPGSVRQVLQNVLY